MATIVKEKTPIVVPDMLRRRAGIKAGDRLEFKLSGGIINIIPTLPNVDDEYTLEERQNIDTELAGAEEDIKRGRTYGPFATHKEFIASLRKEVKKLRSLKKTTNRLAK